MNPTDQPPEHNEPDFNSESPAESNAPDPESRSDSGRPELGRIRSRRSKPAPSRRLRESGPTGSWSSGGGDDDGLPPLVVGEGRSSKLHGPNRLLPLIILVLLACGIVGAAIMMWNKHRVERRAAAILADMDNKGGGGDESSASSDFDSRYPSAPDLRWPIEGEISSPFGYRIHPISKEKKLHNGIDIAAPYWKEVFAAANGKVAWAGKKGGMGNTVIVRHNRAYETYYCHLQKCKVKKGEEVLKGDLIGWVGSTGYSRGPHLHLELHKNGVAVDPAPYLPEPTEAMLKRMKENGIETLSD